MKALLLLPLVSLLAGASAAGAEYATFDEFYSPSLSFGLWEWLAIVVVAAFSAVLVYATFGGATPVVATIGTWIGNAVGLSGAAATSYGLALLGGGAIAAGGLGVAGGAALLTAALTSVAEVSSTYAIKATEAHFDNKRFAAASIDMLTLPPPRNTDGPAGYKAALKTLSSLDLKAPLSEKNNQEILGNAIDVSHDALKATRKKEERCRLYALVALLRFQQNDYESARIASGNAIEIARGLERRRTLPAMIHATSSLYQPAPDVASIIRNEFRYALLAEPDNRLAPALFATFLDRAMYRYLDGAVTTAHIRSLADIACEDPLKEHAGRCLAIIAARVLVQVKREQATIEGCGTTVSASLKKDLGMPQRLRRHLASYGALLDLLDQLHPALDQRAAKIPKESSITPAKIASMVAEYRMRIPALERIAADFEADQRSGLAAERRAATWPWVLGGGAAVAVGWWIQRRRKALTVG
jgi:hypothetical protein